MRKLLVALALLALAEASEAQTRSRGVAAAAVRLDVYSDFQCPYCKTVHEKMLAPLAADYADKGKLFVVHHEFPLVNKHPYAMQAASYACAANRIGKYREASDVLFRRQEYWSANGKVDETVCSVLTPAEAEKVRALAKDPSVRAEIDQDIRDGMKAHVAGTPTLILSKAGKQYQVPANASYDILRRFIDQLLAN